MLASQRNRLVEHVACDRCLETPCRDDVDASIEEVAELSLRAQQIEQADAVTDVDEDDELKYGDLVAYEWGSGEVRGTVAEVYRPEGRRRVVIALDPEVSGYVVAEPTTVALSVEDVRRVEPL